MNKPMHERIFEKFKNDIGNKFKDLESPVVIRAKKVCEILCSFNPPFVFQISVEKVFIGNTKKYRNEIFFRVKEPLDLYVQVGLYDVEMWANFTNILEKKEMCIQIDMSPDNFEDYVDLIFHQNDSKIDNDVLRLFHLIFRRHLEAYDKKRKR